MATKLMQSSDLEPILELAESHRLALRSAEAASALIELTYELPHVRERQLAARLVSAGRRLATPETVSLLLDQAADASADHRGIAAALRFSGSEAIRPALERGHDAQELSVRRRYYELVTALGEFPELRSPLITQLHLSLSDRRWYVVRDAILLITVIGASLPLDHLWDLARARHRQVRLALTQVIARWKASPDGLDLLTALLDDEDAGVRFAAATALGPYAHPRARQALARRAAHEQDPEAKAACQAALSRRVVSLRSA